MINFKTESLKEQVLYKLNRISGDITCEDVDSIKTLDLNNVGIANTFNPIFFDDLLYFTNLEELSVFNIMLGDSDWQRIITITTLKKLSFYNCNISSLLGISKLKELKTIEFTRCAVRDMSDILNLNNLEELTIINTNFNKTILNISSKLKYFDCSYSDITNIKDINLLNVETLNISNTKIRDISCLDNCLNLKKLIIDKSSFDSHQELMKKLIQNKINIYDEHLLLIGGVNNEY